MNYFKMRVLLKEFPFLKSLLTETYWRECASSDVERFKSSEDCINTFAVEIIPSEKEGSFTINRVLIPEEISIKRIDEDVLNLCCSYCDGDGWGECESFEMIIHGKPNVSLIGDLSVGEFLARNEISPEYIVRVKREWDDDYCKKNVIIYKMNKFDLEAFYSAQIDRAAAQVKAEILAACAGGE